MKVTFCREDFAVQKKLNNETFQESNHKTLGLQGEVRSAEEAGLPWGYP